MIALTVIPVLFGLWAMAAHAEDVRRPPDWISRPPSPGLTGMAYFVGMKDDAPDLEEGREAAFRDATKQIAAFLQTNISQQFISRRDQRQSSVIDKIVSASAGRLAGVRVLQTYFERRLGGRWPLRREVLSVWVLVGFPQGEIDKERSRLKGLHNVFKEQIVALCDDQAGWLLLHARNSPVLVRGFHEAATNEVLAISRIIEDELSGCLVSRGIRVAAQGSGIISSGAYYRAAGGAIVITGFLARPNGTKLMAKSVSIADDAMGPGWLDREDPLPSTSLVDTGESDTTVVAPQDPAAEALREQPSPVIEQPMLDGGDYLNLFGGWVALSGQHSGAGKSGQLVAQFYAAKYVYFIKNRMFGIGSSAIESYWGPWKVHYQQASPMEANDFNESPNIVSRFPVHAVISPFRGRRWFGHTMGAPSLSYTFSAWGYLHLRHAPSQDSKYSPPSNVVIHNVNISLPVGNWTSIQGGFLSVRQPGFTVGQEGTNQKGKPQTTTWTVPDFEHQQWYLGVELHFGGRL